VGSSGALKSYQGSLFFAAKLKLICPALQFVTPVAASFPAKEYPAHPATRSGPQVWARFNVVRVLAIFSPSETTLFPLP